MDKNELSPKEYCSNDSSTTQKSSVLELAKKFSGDPCNLAVKQGENYVIKCDEIARGVENTDINMLENAPRVLGDLAALMLPVPKRMQEATARAVSLVAFEILSNVFDISVSLTSFNAIGFALKQMDAKLEELQRKMDILLMSDYKTASHLLKHAMNYLENTKTHPKAFDRFKALSYTHLTLPTNREV